MPNDLKQSILFNSGLTIRDKSYLSSLAVFYDHTFLPAEISREIAVVLYTGFNGRWRIIEGHTAQSEPRGSKPFDKDVRIWEATNQPLFEEGIISRLDMPDRTLINEGISNLARLVEYINTVATKPNPQADPYYQGLSKWLGRDVNSMPVNTNIYMDMYFHQLRRDISLPEIFAIPEDNSHRELYKFILAQSTLKYLVPKLSDLEPEQILETREAVAGHREGFSMHLQTLSAGVEERLNANETVKEISKYAQSIIETQLIPDYREFNRILKAREANRKGKILDIAGKILEIDAPIGSPKFFAQLLQAFGNALTTDAEEREAQLSNRNQAYLFMRAVERNQIE